MRALLQSECARQPNQYYRVLEIGSWAGGSAILWAETLKQFNNGKGSVFCVDPWRRYEIGGQGGVYVVMDEALR